MIKIIFTASVMLCLSQSFAQVSQPFSSCPAIVAVARSGTNTYSNEPVSFYNLNPASGNTSLIAGGPLKDPANPANNMDMNGTGLNAADGYIYGMRPESVTTPKFYRMGSNYSVEQIGTIAAPVPVAPANTGVVNAAAADFNGGGTYYITAATAVVSFFPAPSATPKDFYVGTISNVAALPASTSATITPAYVKLDFSGANCSGYYSTITAPVASAASIQNTGLRDLIYNPRDGKLYTYVTFETSPGSGVFMGQLFSLVPATGVVTCYAASTLPFASATNEVAGTAMTVNGEIEVLFTDGTVYKTDLLGTNIFAGTISPLGSSGITGGLRGDLAGCILAAAVPVTLESFSGAENNCTVRYQWTVSQEANMGRYDVEILNKSGQFVSAAQVTPTNTDVRHSYSITIPASEKTMTARLKQTDLDGSFTYSDIVRINTNCEKTKSISILNSGSLKDDLQIRWNNFTPEDVSVSVYNATGSLISRKNVNTGTAAGISNISISQLPSGVYLIAAQTASGEKFTERFIKN
jgi:hypothetical protein